MYLRYSFRRDSFDMPLSDQSIQEAGFAPTYSKSTQFQISPLGESEIDQSDIQIAIPVSPLWLNSR